MCLKINIALCSHKIWQSSHKSNRFHQQLSRCCSTQGRIHDTERLLLSLVLQHVSVATEKVKGATVVKISDDFLAKAFEGDYSNSGKWVKEVKKIVAEARMLLELGEGRCDKFYFYYPTCPKCAKIYGKNQVVILALL